MSKKSEQAINRRWLLTNLAMAYLRNYDPVIIRNELGIPRAVWGSHKNGDGEWSFSIELNDDAPNKLMAQHVGTDQVWWEELPDEIDYKWLHNLLDSSKNPVGRGRLICPKCHVDLSDRVIDGLMLANQCPDCGSHLD